MLNFNKLIRKKDQDSSQIVRLKEERLEQGDVPAYGILRAIHEVH